MEGATLMPCMHCDSFSGREGSNMDGGHCLEFDSLNDSVWELGIYI